MPHDHPASGHPSHGEAGHNVPPETADHLHSHMAPEDEAAALQALTGQFIEGFRAATDKAAFLKIAGVPLEIASQTGGPMLKLVDLSIREDWQVGTASPAFGSDELSYLPFPGAMIKDRVACVLVYVSLRERRDLDLRLWLSSRGI